MQKAIIGKKIGMLQLRRQLKTTATHQFSLAMAI